jgi:hypothetical protein
MPFPAFYEEETMKISTIALAAVVALSTSSVAFAKHHHHHHKHGMTMGSSSGPSGPRMDGGGTDKSRPGTQGVSKKPAGE